MRLKSDLFGTVTCVRDARGELDAWVERDARVARAGLRWLARRLMAREARALGALAGMSGVPTFIERRGDVLLRSWIEGRPLQEVGPRDPIYFREALRLVRRLHRAGVAHNDLAKEPNWLVDPAGRPALVDFQLATVARRRGRWFRLLAREDLRHLLKHKRTYCPQRLTARERRILASPSVLSRLWQHTGKRLYRFVTRRLLGWADREGAGDRRWNS